MKRFIFVPLLLFSLGAVVFLTKDALAYRYLTPVAETQRGDFNYLIKAYDLIAGDYQTPARGFPGATSKSTEFKGHYVYEYFYPSCPRKNTEDRPTLFEFKEDGTFEIAGNFVVSGDRTYLSAEDDGTVSFYELKENARGNDVTTSFLKLDLRGMKVDLASNVILNEEWNDINDLKPSVYFNGEGGKLEFTELHSISRARNNKIFKKNFENGSSGLGETYLEDGNGLFQLSNPTQFVVKKGEGAQGVTFFITDKDNHRVVEYTPGNITLPGEEDGYFKGMGGLDWNWTLEGLAVDFSDDDMIYVTDSANDTLIKFRMDGTGWIEYLGTWFDRYRDVFLKGEERINLEAKEVGGIIKDEISFFDSSFAKKSVIASSTNGFFQYDAVTKKIGMQNTGKNVLFGQGNYYFDGTNSLIVDANNVKWFSGDPVTVDFWFKFNTIDESQAFFSQENNFWLGWYNEPGEIKRKLSFYGQTRTPEGLYEEVKVRRDWDPKVNTWYHMALTYGDGELRLFVDGELMGGAEDVGSLDSRESVDLVVGAYGNANHFRGYLDNFRFFKGASFWNESFFPEYSFSDPEGIILVGDYLYVADTSNNRIIKVKKDYSEWYSYGEYGTGAHQFIRPTDITYEDTFFYIVDSGNKRVVKTDLNPMQKLFKHEEGNPLPTWNVIYSGEESGGYYDIYTKYQQITAPFEITSILSKRYYNGLNMRLYYPSEQYVEGQEPAVIGFQDEEGELDETAPILEASDCGAGCYEFYFPPRYSIEYPKNRFIFFKDGLRPKFIKLRLEKAGTDPIAVDVNNGDVYISDGVLGGVLKNGAYLVDEVADDIYRYKKVVDIIADRPDRVFLLDGVSENDISVYSDAENHLESLKIYGNKRERDIGAFMATGGLDGVFTYADSIYHKKPDNPDPNSGDDVGGDRIWVGDSIGPGIAHCQELENEATQWDSSTYDVWHGLGPNVNCKSVSPPSECVNQWDYEEIWPDCTYYVPAVISSWSECVAEECKTITQGEFSWETCWCTKYIYHGETGCVAQSPSCHEGYAVRHRPDYRTISISLVPNGENACIYPMTTPATETITINLFYDLVPERRNMEYLIKEVEDKIYDPKQISCNCTFSEEGFLLGCEECPSCKTFDWNIINLLVDSGWYSEDPDFNFKEYLQPFAGMLIKSATVN